MPEKSNVNGNWLRWLIFLLVAATFIVTVLNYISPRPTPKPSEGQNPINPIVSPERCYIAGRVYNSADNQPLPNVEIRYLRVTHDENDYIHSVKSHLATTDVDGKFEADCSHIEAENFPFRLVLKNVNWVTEYQTNEVIQHGARKTAINPYVPDNNLRNIPPHPIPQHPIPPHP